MWIIYVQCIIYLRFVRTLQTLDNNFQFDRNCRFPMEIFLLRRKILKKQNKKTLYVYVRFQSQIRHIEIDEFINRVLNAFDFTRKTIN